MKPSMPAPSGNIWESGALLTKAQRYADEMLAQGDRSDWHFPFWSSLTLELIARAALAHVSPALLADPEDWSNLLYALGRTPTASKFSPKSISTLKVFARLRDLLPRFDKELEAFCIVHTAKRNAELHSAETPFDVGKSSEWLPNFYRSCEVLLESMGSDLEAIFGEDDAEAATKMIAAAVDKAAKAIAGDVDAHKRVWDKKDDAERETLGEQAAVWATRQNGHVVSCPACGSKALIEGEPISAPKKSIDGDEITESQAMLPSKFECIACGLKMSKLAQLNACGMGDVFTRTEQYDAVSYYASEDEFGGWEPDNNEPF